MIPPRIYTIWLNENKKLPPLVEMCVGSHKLDGYEHKMITLDNCFKDSEYIQQCLNSKAPGKWSKASDYLRMYYLYNEGGIYLDADVQIVPNKNFTHLLKYRGFAAREYNGFVGTAVIGFEAKHPFLKEWINAVEHNFRGDDNKCFESSVELLSRGCYERNWTNDPKWQWDDDGLEVFDPDYFYPYNHQDGSLNMTDRTITFHYFMKSWGND